MASVVDLCNLALARIGDDASVSSIDPPEGSPQAQHCARFYPLALRLLLDQHSWNFAVTRVVLDRLSVSPLSGWTYAYGQPSNAISLIALYDAGSSDDSRPLQYALEILSDGTGVVYANEPAVVLKYVEYVSDPGRFSPMFADTLVWLLSSYLAGPILKGESGIKVSQYCLGVFKRMLGEAMADDANQRNVHPTHRVPWFNGRPGQDAYPDTLNNAWTANPIGTSVL